MLRAVFFDRDGVVNRSPGNGYVERWEDFHVLPEFIGALRVTRRLGYAALVVTNQSCIGKGIVSRATVEDIHRRCRELLAQDHGLELLDIRYCPHAGDTCPCRKPKPGMLLDAAAQHGISLPDSWMVGDSPRDIEAGRRAGCHTLLVGPKPPADSRPDHILPDLRNLESGLESLLRTC